MTNLAKWLRGAWKEFGYLGLRAAERQVGHSTRSVERGGNEGVAWDQGGMRLGQSCMGRRAAGASFHAERGTRVGILAF